MYQLSKLVLTIEWTFFVNSSSILTCASNAGVIAGTSPFLMNAGSGSLRIEFGNGSRLYLLDGGFARMQDDVLTLLADDIIPADQIELSEAEEELAAASAAATEAGRTSAHQRKEIEQAQDRAQAKVQLAKATSSRPGSI